LKIIFDERMCRIRVVIIGVVIKRLSRAFNIVESAEKAIAGTWHTIDLEKNSWKSCRIISDTFFPRYLLLNLWDPLHPPLPVEHVICNITKS
jgi:hypothetical protein